MANNETLAYVINRFTEANLDQNEILIVIRQLKHYFDTDSEDELEELAKQHIKNFNIRKST